MSSLDHLADQFCRAFYERSWPGDSEPEVENLSLEDAYKVQRLVTRKRLELGDSVVGYKVGCTSEAVQRQFGLKEPIIGRLFSPHTRRDVEAIHLSRYANCAVEPEMVFKIAHDLEGEELSDDELLAGIDSISPGIELHHYRFWKFPPTTQELICSGGIHAGLAIGASSCSPDSLSFRDERFAVRVNGHQIAEGRASEIMGGPLQSLRWLVASLTHNGRRLERGSIVIPGSPVQLTPIEQPCELEIEIEGVGDMTVRCEQ